MNSFKNPLTPLVPNPVNLDVPTNELQLSLSGIPWIEASFGRAWRVPRKETNGKIIYYPEVWQGEGKDLLNVMENDNLAAHCFWYFPDPANINNWNNGLYSRIERPAHLFVLFNLDKINPAATYRFTEELKRDLLDKLRNTRLSSATLTVNRVFEQASQVFNVFTINEAENQTFVHPWGGFRIECLLNYTEHCN